MAHFFINEKIIEVIHLANSLMEEHGVGFYNLDFCNDKSLLGCCTADTIKINYLHALNNDIEDVRDTILHEIAHAIAGNENGHNEYWKSIAKEMGVKIK